MPSGVMGIGSIDLGIQVEGLPQAARVLKEVQNAAKAFKIDSKLVKRMVDAQKAGNAEMQRLLARASGVMDPKGIANAFKKADAEFADLLAKWKDAHKRSDQAAAKQIEMQMAALDQRLSKELKAQERMLRRREQAEEDIRKAWEDLAGDFTDQLGDNLEGLFGKMKSRDMKGLFESGGKLFAKGAKGLGGQMTAGAAEGSMMMKMGGALTKLGAAAGAIGAAVGVLALAVKTIIDAEAQAKEFNKTLMEGASYADLAWEKNAQGLVNVQEELQHARQAATFLSFQFRELPKDMMNILQAANQAGLTFKEMKTDLGLAGTAMYNYSEVMRVALVYSKNLGQTTTDIAEQTAKWHHDFGMGLREIEESFAAIAMVAMQAGISTKRFYTMVTGATSGMAIYNNRIEEAAALLVQLTDILGEDLGDSLAQSLTKGFTDEGYQERMKRVMIAGGADTGEIMARSAEDTARKLAGRLREQGGMEALSSRGINIETEEGRKKLAGLGGKEARALLTEVRGADKENARQLETLINLSKGAQGGLSNQAQALGSLDMGGKLAMMLQTLGDRALSEMGAVELAAFEQYAGISGEQLEALKRVDGAIRGNFEELTRLQKSGERFTAEQQKEQVKQFGAYVSDSGEIIRSAIDDTSEKGFVEGGAALDSLGDYIQSQGDMLAEAVETGMSADEAIATDIARNTLSVATLLEVGVQNILEQIYTLLSSWFGSGNEFDEAALEESRQEQKRLGEAMSGLREELGQLYKERDQAVGEEKDRLDEEIKKKETALTGHRELMRLEANRQQKIYGGAEGFLQAAPNVEDVRAAVIRTYGEEAGGEIVANTGPAMMGSMSYFGAIPGYTEGQQLMSYLESGDQEEVFAGALEPLDMIGDDTLKEIEKQGKDRKEDITMGTYDAQKRLEAERIAGRAGFTPGTAEFENVVMGLMGGTVTEDLGKAFSTARGGATTTEGVAAFNKLMDDTMALGVSIFDPNIGYAPAVDDFIYRGNAQGGTITAIHPGDELLGGKEGGPLSSMMGGAVNIHIHGGDQQAVYRTVRKALGASGRKV